MQREATVLSLLLRKKTCQVGDHLYISVVLAHFSPLLPLALPWLLTPHSYSPFGNSTKSPHVMTVWIWRALLFERAGDAVDKLDDPTKIIAVRGEDTKRISTHL